MRSLGFFLFLFGFGLVAHASAHAQDFILSASDGSGPPGGSATITVNLDSSAGATVLQGWSFGLCHDSALVSVGDVLDGSTTATVAGGNPPDFNTVNLFTDGWTVGVVISFLGTFQLPLAPDHELNITTYDLNAAFVMGSTPLDFCDSLGAPPVATVVVAGGASFPPTTVPGSITVSPIVEFKRGDCNDDDLVDIADGIWLLSQLFQMGASTDCPESCNVNDDGGLDAADAIYLFSYVLLGGPPPPSPFPSCGPKDDPDDCDGSSCP